jgi:hypothetical protein
MRNDSQQRPLMDIILQKLAVFAWFGFGMLIVSAVIAVIVYSVHLSGAADNKYILESRNPPCVNQKAIDHLRYNGVTRENVKYFDKLCDQEKEFNQIQNTYSTREVIIDNNLNVIDNYECDDVEYIEDDVEYIEDDCDEVEQDVVPQAKQKTKPKKSIEQLHKEITSKAADDVAIILGKQ